jgi:isopenicillin N synthase-like dioxygenase
METLATVDMSPAFAGAEGEKHVAEALRNAATTVGFLYLINHGVPSEVIKNAYEQLHKFFDLPLDVKMKVHTSLSAGVRGYIGIYEQVCLSWDALDCCRDAYRQLASNSGKLRPGHHRPTRCSSRYVVLLSCNNPNICHLNVHNP